MSSSGAPSLRDLYNRPSSSWSFVPAPEGSNGPSASASIGASQPTDSAVYQWPSRSNSLYDLSSAIDIDSSSFDVSEAIRATALQALLLFFSTAVEIPWEVGKTLLQVQYVPREANVIEDEAEVVEEEASAEIFKVSRTHLVINSDS